MRFMTYVSRVIAMGLVVVISCNSASANLITSSLSSNNGSSINAGIVSEQAFSGRALLEINPLAIHLTATIYRLTASTLAAGAIAFHSGLSHGLMAGAAFLVAAITLPTDPIEASKEFSVFTRLYNEINGPKSAEDLQNDFLAIIATCFTSPKFFELENKLIFHALRSLDIDWGTDELNTSYENKLYDWLLRKRPSSKLFTFVKEKIRPGQEEVSLTPGTEQQLAIAARFKDKSTPLSFLEELKTLTDDKETQPWQTGRGRFLNGELTRMTPSEIFNTLHLSVHRTKNYDQLKTNDIVVYQNTSGAYTILVYEHSELIHNNITALFRDLLTGNLVHVKYSEMPDRGFFILDHVTRWAHIPEEPPAVKVADSPDSKGSFLAGLLLRFLQPDILEPQKAPMRHAIKTTIERNKKVSWDEMLKIRNAPKKTFSAIREGDILIREENNTFQVLNVIALIPPSARGPAIQAVNVLTQEILILRTEHIAPEGLPLFTDREQLEQANQPYGFFRRHWKDIEQHLRQAEKDEPTLGSGLFNYFQTMPVAHWNGSTIQWFDQDPRFFPAIPEDLVSKRVYRTWMAMEMGAHKRKVELKQEIQAHEVVHRTLTFTRQFANLINSWIYNFKTLFDVETFFSDPSSPHILIAAIEKAIYFPARYEGKKDEAFYMEELAAFRSTAPALIVEELCAVEPSLTLYAPALFRLITQMAGHNVLKTNNTFEFIRDDERQIVTTFNRLLENAAFIPSEENFDMFHKLSAELPKNIILRKLILRAERRRGHRQRMETAAYELMSVDHDAPEIFEVLMQCNLERGNLSKAIEFGERWAFLDHTNASAYHSLSLAYEKAGNIRKRDEYNKKAYHLNPQLNAEIIPRFQNQLRERKEWLDQIFTFKKNNDTSQAFSLCENALMRWPGDFSLMNLFVDLLITRNENEKALSMAKLNACINSKREMLPRFIYVFKRNGFSTNNALRVFNKLKTFQEKVFPRHPYIKPALAAA